MSLEYSGKQSSTRKIFISERVFNHKNVVKLENIKKQEQKTYRTKISYKGYKTKYDFTNFKNIRSFEDPIRNGGLMMVMANDKQDISRKKNK